MNCPYCGKEAIWCENKTIYGKNYGDSYMCYLCKDCDAYVGCHKNTTESLGTMANKELRELRVHCHLEFDKFWKSGYLKRREAYKYLAEIMGMGEAHIGGFSIQECLKLLKKLNPGKNYMKNKILVLQGLPASGKSTFAKELMEKEPGKWKRVNKDLFRLMLDNGVWNDKNEKFILKIRDAIIINALELGINVILDDCNFAPKHIRRMNEIAEEVGATVEIKFFDVPLYECIERDKKRPAPVGERVIIKMHAQYLRSRNECKTISFDEKLPNCVICDIDGTLAYSPERSPYDYRRVLEDLPNKNLMDILDIIKESRKASLFIFSGREAVCAHDTQAWVELFKIKYDLIAMRKEKDMRPDEIIKEEMYNEHVKGKYNVIAVFDDRPKVIRMWKKLGLFVMDCNRGDSRVQF